MVYVPPILANVPCYKGTTINVPPVSPCNPNCSLDSTPTCLRTWKSTGAYSLVGCKKSEETGNEEYDSCAWPPGTGDSRWQTTAHDRSPASDPRIGPAFHLGGLTETARSQGDATLRRRQGGTGACRKFPPAWRRLRSPHRHAGPMARPTPMARRNLSRLQNSGGFPCIPPPPSTSYAAG